MVKRSSISLAQDRESSPARTDVLTTMLRHQLCVCSESMDGSSVEYDDDDMLGFEFTQSTDADAAAADVMSCDNDDQSVLC